MRCKERILLYNVSLGLSTTKRWQFFLFFCFLYLRGESGALWQNSKAGERTDVLWWLMCFSSPVKSRAPCLLHPPLSSYRVPPSILSLRVRATLQLCVWWDGRPARFGHRHDNVPSEHSGACGCWGQDESYGPPGEIRCGLMMRSFCGDREPYGII